MKVSGDLGAEVDADPDHLRRAVRNLVENAVNYTGAGGRVGVEVWRRNEEVGLTVTDTGPGIPVVDAQNVFDRFYQTAGGRSRGGSRLHRRPARGVPLRPAAHLGRGAVLSRIRKHAHRILLAEFGLRTSIPGDRRREPLPRCPAVTPVLQCR